MKISRRTLYSSILAILFFIAIYNSALSVITGLTFMQYSDELLLVVYLPVSIYHIFRSPQKRLLSIFIWIFVSIFYFITLFRGTHLTALDLLMASLINVKLIIFFDFALIVFKDYKVVMRLINIIIGFSLLGLFLNVLLGENFNSLFGYKLQYRFDNLRIGGFEGNSNNMALLIVAIFLYYNFFIRKFQLKFFLLTSVLLVLICTFWLGSRSPFFVFVAISVAFYLKTRIEKRALALVFLPVLAFIGFILVSETDIKDSEEVQMLLTNLNSIKEGNDSKYMRGIMLANGIKLMEQNFPFGSGIGTFASVYANKYYNPIYQEIGLYTNKKGLLENGGLYDSNFASIVGEYGFFGFLLFLALFLFAVYQVKQGLLKQYNIYFYTWIFYILYSFIVRATFNNSYPSVIFVTFFIMLNDPRIKNKKLDI